MKVFVSWSGGSSRAVAEILQWWFPKVLQGVKPFVSAKDIDKGANWTVELARELEEADFGVVCLTPDNLTSPWLHYETGAITRSVASRVCPLLHGVEKLKVTPPLSQLQLTDLDDKQDVFQLMTSMNKAAGSTLSSEDLREVVDMWWPRLAERLASVKVSETPAGGNASEPKQPETTDRELLLQVLDAVRRLDRPVPPQSYPKINAERRLRELAVRLREEGMDMIEAQAGLDVWELVVADLPEPLPSSVYIDVSRTAKRHAVKIRLRTLHAERIVEFDRDGVADEPPF